MSKAHRPDWSRPLSRPLIIPGVMTLKTLADVRELIEKRLRKEHRERSTWRRVAAQIADVANGGDVAGAVIALRLVLMLERVECRPK